MSAPSTLTIVTSSSSTTGTLGTFPYTELQSHDSARKTYTLPNNTMTLGSFFTITTNPTGYTSLIKVTVAKDAANNSYGLGDTVRFKMWNGTSATEIEYKVQYASSVYSFVVNTTPTVATTGTQTELFAHLNSLINSNIVTTINGDVTLKAKLYKLMLDNLGPNTSLTTLGTDLKTWGETSIQSLLTAGTLTYTLANISSTTLSANMISDICAYFVYYGTIADSTVEMRIETSISFANPTSNQNNTKLFTFTNSATASVITVMFSKT